MHILNKIIISLIIFFLCCFCLKLKNEVERLRYENRKLKYGKTPFINSKSDVPIFLTKWEKKECEKFNNLAWTEACKGKIELYDLVEKIRHDCILGLGMTADEAFKELIKEFQSSKKNYNSSDKMKNINIKN